jgi:hypothetical protein
MSDHKDKNTLKEWQGPSWPNNPVMGNAGIGHADTSPRPDTSTSVDGEVPSLSQSGHRMLMVTSPEEGTLRIDLGVPAQVGYDEVDTLLPYDGVRGVVHRSTWAKTGMFVARTEEDGWLSRPVGHEAALERATAISALIHPNTFGLKSQPRKVHFKQPVAEVKSNTLDYLVTLKTGQKIYLFVKNEETLGRPKTALVCAEIRRNLPKGYGFATISEATFPPNVRGNNNRMFLAKRFPDPAADARLEEVLEDLVDVPKFTIEELVFRCKLGPRQEDNGRAFDAILRSIADKKLAANVRALIHYPTVVERAA